jgi:hypothetical protein
MFKLAVNFAASVAIALSSIPTWASEAPSNNLQLAFERAQSLELVMDDILADLDTKNGKSEKDIKEIGSLYEELNEFYIEAQIEYLNLLKDKNPSLALEKTKALIAKEEARINAINEKINKNKYSSIIFLSITTIISLTMFIFTIPIAFVSVPVSIALFSGFLSLVSYIDYKNLSSSKLKAATEERVVYLNAQRAIIEREITAGKDINLEIQGLF